MREATISNRQHLQAIARRVMIDRGFLPEFGAAVLAELGAIPGPTATQIPRGPGASGFQGLDVGDRVSVELVGTNVEHGFIDFARSTGRAVN